DGFGNTALADLSTPTGTVVGFEFNAQGPVSAPGVYDSTLAGREISEGNGLSAAYEYTTGVLTVSQVQAIPEPGTLEIMAMGGMGLVGFGGMRRRSRRFAHS
ncbi:MAG: PEP-CTERM sorting domain-containing protein, partial [Terriglobia bacterium]